jgi:UDP-glucose 4-epimerase
MAVEAHTAYEASRLARERYAEYCANHHEMNMASLRFLSDCQGSADNEQRKSEYANTVAQFADAIGGGVAPGPFGDDNQTRNLIYLTDITRACEVADDEELTGFYNVGTGYFRRS